MHHGDYITTFTKKKLYIFLEKLGGQRHFYAVKGGFICLTPLMIAGSIAVLINNFPINAYQVFMSNLFGENWRIFGDFFWHTTFSVISAAAAVTISTSLAAWYNNNKSVEILPAQCAVVSLCAYLSTCYTGLDTEKLSTSSMGTAGLFIAIVTAITTTEAMVFLTRKIKINSFNYVDEPGGSVANTFSAILPSAITLSAFAFLRLLTFIFQIKPLQEAINGLLILPFEHLGNGAASAFLFVAATNLLWVLGFHGSNMLDNVANSVFAGAASDGTISESIFTKTFFDVFIYMGGAGATLCLIIALLLFSKRSTQREIAKISMFPAVFNINEILLYGIPVILNPIYALPFVLAPIVMLLSSYAAISLGIVPKTCAEITWTTPIFISGYIASGRSLAGVFLQAFNMLLGVFLYRPFVQTAEKMRITQFERTYSDLCNICDDSLESSVDKRVLSRKDAIGSTARLLSFDLKNALQNANISFCFQPICNGKTGKVVGAETLVRWQHHEHGLISASVVSALSDDMSLISRLDELALKAACEGVRSWRANGLSIYATVNFSASELKNESFSEFVLKTIRSFDLPLNCIMIELTESLALGDDAATVKNIKNLVENGVRISIDDFGMGHSSLAYIKRFPFSALKVDKSLSRDILTVSENLEIIKSVNTLCKNLGIQMVVEYVETAAQVELLEVSTDALDQGYHFSKALPPNDFIEYCKSKNRDD